MSTPVFFLYSRSASIHNSVKILLVSVTLGADGLGRGATEDGLSTGGMKDDFGRGTWEDGSDEITAGAVFIL